MLEMFKIFLYVAALLVLEKTAALTTNSSLAFENHPTGFSNYTTLRTSNAYSSRSGYPADCAEATAQTKRSGLYVIHVPLFIPQPFVVYCEYVVGEGGWTVVQRRQDGSIDFYRGWDDYKHGFGNLDGEFWLGLDQLHALTNSAIQELKIVMRDFENSERYASYASFVIGNEAQGYALKALGTYSGNAVDSMYQDAGQKFSTKDVKNHDGYDCAVGRHSAWWFNGCSWCNPNGKYYRGPYTCSPNCNGTFWSGFRGDQYSLKFMQFMIRPRSTN